MWNLPNILTLLRIALIPVFIVVYYLPWEWHHFASAAIFGLAALTDWVDGYLARKFNQVTPFGAFLDPVADKLIVVAALVLLLEVHSTPGLRCRRLSLLVARLLYPRCGSGWQSWAPAAALRSP